jgi:Kef-type K+ transport system membrane component KefB
VRQLLGIALLLAIGLVVSHRWFGKVKVWGAQRFFFLTGEEFLLLGLVLGPEATALIDRSTLTSLEPFVGLGLGYVGFVFGMQFRARDLAQVPPRYYLATCLQNGVASAVLFAALFWGLGLVVPGAGLPLALAGVATALGSSTSFLFHLDRRTRLGRSELFRFMRFSAVFDDLFGVVLFGAALCLMHRAGPLGEALPGLQWLAMSVLLGATSGALLLWGARMGLGDREELLVLLGMVLFTGGVATYLMLSPVLTNLIAGILFANLDRRVVRYHTRLLTVEKPIYLFMMVLAGALWKVAWGAGLLLLLGVYVGGRAVGKYAGGMGAAMAIGVGRARGRHLGLGLSAQSEMSVVMAINLLLLHQTPGVALLVSAIFFGMIIHDLTSSAYYAYGCRRG